MLLIENLLLSSGYLEPLVGEVETAHTAILINEAAILLAETEVVTRVRTRAAVRNAVRCIDSDTEEECK